MTAPPSGFGIMWSPSNQSFGRRQVLVSLVFIITTIIIKSQFTEALTKQKGPNICWDAYLYLVCHFLNFNYVKKTCQKWTSQQMFGPSYFDVVLSTVLPVLPPYGAPEVHIVRVLGDALGIWICGCRLFCKGAVSYKISSIKVHT